MYADPDGNFIISALVIGAIAGVAIGFGITAYSDYADDGKVFNGSVSAGHYITNSAIGGIAGAVIGYAAPYIGSFAPVLAGENAVAISVSSAKVLAAGAAAGTVSMLASEHRPQNNKKQNEQFRAAMREIGIKDKSQMRRVHDKIRGRNMGYKELVNFIKEVLKLQ